MQDEVELILPVVRRIVLNNQDKAVQVKLNPALIGWFVGQVMKEFDGKVDAKVVLPIVTHELGVSI